MLRNRQLVNLHGSTPAACVCAYIVAVGTQLPEGLDEEPGPFISRAIQRDSHGVLLQQSRQTFVHRQIFITLHVEKLYTDEGQKNIMQVGFSQTTAKHT